ncbi:MAG: methyltransferase, partial [Bacteroidetes bacterium]
MITGELNDYILSHIDEEEEILQKINRETNAKMIHPRMMSGHLQGKVLKMLTQMINPQNVLEIGTYTGYSAISIAFGLNEKSKIVTIDINDEIENFTRKFINKSKLNNKIEFIIGDALKIIPSLNKKFDMIFIDGEKDEYVKYYDTVFDKLK